MGRRPYCSESGPQISGPTQYPATKSEIKSAPTSLPKWNLTIRSATIPEGIELANVLEECYISTSREGRVADIRIENQQTTEDREEPPLCSRPVLWIFRVVRSKTYFVLIPTLLTRVWSVGFSMILLVQIFPGVFVWLPVIFAYYS